MDKIRGYDEKPSTRTQTMVREYCFLALLLNEEEQKPKEWGPEGSENKIEHLQTVRFELTRIAPLRMRPVLTGKQ